MGVPIMRRALLAVAVLLGILTCGALVSHTYVLGLVCGVAALVAASASERIS